MNVLIHSYFPCSPGIIFMQFLVFIKKKKLLKVSGNILLNIAITSLFISYKGWHNFREKRGEMPGTRNVSYIFID